MPAKLTIPAIADLHFNAAPHERLEQGLDAVLFPWLEANHFDAFLNLGDLYDSKISLDSPASKAAFRFAVRLCQICQSRGVPLRFLVGTITHDHGQLENLRPLETEFPVFRVVSTTTPESLLPGFDVLWMPEVYPQDYADHYSQFLYAEGGDVVYDGIFGHGEIDVAAKWSGSSESERTYGGTPTHMAERLLLHSAGPVWFGHVHEPFRYKGRLGYVGSFDRWAHGEPGAKGFDVLTLTRKKDLSWTVAAKKIWNTAAPVYRKAAAEELYLLSDGPQEILAKTREAADGVHRLRVDFSGFEIGVEEFSIVRGALVDDRRVELVRSAKGAAPPPGGEAAAAPDSSYLRDSAVPAQERLLRFIHEKHGEDCGVTIDDVNLITAPPGS